MSKLLRRPLAVLGILVLAAVLASALLAPWIAPASPTRMDIAHRLAPPSAAHWFGTDDFGRDVLSRAIFGARVSVLAGALVVMVSGVAGATLGLLAGSLPRFDNLLMRFADALMSFPDILLAIALMAALGPSLGNVVIALGTVYTPRVARLVRASVLVLRRLTFVETAEAMGAGEWRIIWVHILPNLLSPLLVQATFTFAAAVLTEAALSFLGAGIPPSSPSWGNMIAGAQQYIDRAAWLVFAPGGAILFTVLSLQILGDALRDALDPKLRRLT